MLLKLDFVSGGGGGFHVFVTSVCCFSHHGPIDFFHSSYLTNSVTRRREGPSEKQDGERHRLPAAALKAPWPSGYLLARLGHATSAWSLSSLGGGRESLTSVRPSMGTHSFTQSLQRVENEGETSPTWKHFLGMLRTEQNNPMALRGRERAVRWAGGWIGCLAGWLAVWLVGGMVGWLVVRLAGWWVGWISCTGGVNTERICKGLRAPCQLHRTRP